MFRNRAISDVMLKEGDVFFPLLECKWLAISSSITRDSLPGLDNLLRSTPYLEKLMIAPDGTCGPLALDEAIYLSGDSYLSLQENIFKVSLQNLKNVKVISPCYGCIPRAEAAEFPQFLKFLLERVINLEKMVIAPEHKKCNFCSTDISELMESVLAFPTTSKTAVVSLGSVNPQCFSR